MYACVCVCVCVCEIIWGCLKPEDAFVHDLPPSAPAEDWYTRENSALLQRPQGVKPNFSTDLTPLPAVSLGQSSDTQCPGGAGPREGGEID